VAKSSLIKKEMKGMKTYRNEKHGFEIEIPENWWPAPVPIPHDEDKDLWQYGCPDEAINFEIGPLYPEPSLEGTEKDFVLFARIRGYKDLRISRIVVEGKEHVCASYFINDWMGRRWNKKYAIVLGGTEFAITATCNDPGWFSKREQDWDAIIRSFRLEAPASPADFLTEKEDHTMEKSSRPIGDNTQNVSGGGAEIDESSDITALEQMIKDAEAQLNQVKSKRIAALIPIAISAGIVIHMALKIPLSEYYVIIALAGLLYFGLNIWRFYNAQKQKDEIDAKLSKYREKMEELSSSSTGAG
jgi:hypothetical protein